jgi:hypothetical protein
VLDLGIGKNLTDFVKISMLDWLDDQINIVGCL